ncbi:MAG: serine hydrolase domain-containing protein [Chromatiales bacterium]|jgi:CubicO group peptidase (beta-lactamase class C family)
MASPDRSLRITALLLPVLLLVPVTLAFAKNKSSYIIHEDARHIRESLKPVIAAAQEKFRIPGISLILVRDNEILWSEGFGYADKASRAKATPDTVFRAGSLAKPFTALAVMQLAEQKAIDIDQPLFSYLPGFSIKSRFDSTAQPITLRNILCHHSGLPTDFNKGMWSESDFREVATRLSDEYVAYPPNLVFSYSNIGYTLLGHMVETVSQQVFSDYMQENIFQPLGMQNSGIAPKLNQLPHCATGYSDGKAMPALPIRDIPAFGLYTNANDLGHFMRRFLTQGQADAAFVLSTETLEEMLEPQNQHIPLDMNIINGLGWFIEEDSVIEGGMLLRHGGATLLYSSEMILAPEHGLGVAILANAKDSRKIIAELAMEIIREASSSCASEIPVKLDLADIKPVKINNPQTIGMPGEYVTDFGLISIQAKDDRLCGCIAEETFDLIPYPNGWFGMPQQVSASLPPSYRPLAKLQYKSLKIDGIDVIVAQGNGRQIVLGKKVAPIEMPESWKKRLGKYQLHNPDPLFPVIDTELLMHDEQLYMKYRMPLLTDRTMQIPLRPISDDQAIILGLGRTRGETLWVSRENNGQEIVHYSGFFGSKTE